LPISPRGVDLGDMNGDGAPDVLAVRDSGTGGSRIECLLNSGTGGLLPPISTTSSPPDLANRIRTADFNLDGDLDVLACHYFPNGLLRLFHGNGTGVLVPAFSATTQIMAHGLDVADLNGDGYVDAALSAGDSGPVSGNLFIFLNGPAGLGLSNQVPISFGSTPQSPIVALAIGDLNEDGAADIVNTSDNSSFVFLGTGGGSFTPPVPFDTQGTLPQIVKVTDVDADGNADVLFMDIYGGTGMVAYFGDGVGGFSESHRYISTGYGFDVADVDTDGKPDIGFASGYGSMVILNSRREPAGIERFGVGTPGCIGRYGISVNMDPKVNTPGFAVVGTNAPASSLGLGAYATAASVPGVDLFGTGLLLHLDFLASNEVGLFDPVSDAGGNAWIGVPIPNLPVLAGAVYYLQLFWLVGPTDDCDATTTNGLTSSLGLKVTIAP
jgi:hypothetical protein